MALTDIVGYTYQADTYCPTCAVAHLVLDLKAAPAAVDMDPEDAIRQCVEAAGFDYDDLRTYDSDEFPKPVFSSQIEDEEHCGGCREPLGA